MNIKDFILILGFIFICSVNENIKAQNFNSIFNNSQNDTFKENAVFYRLETNTYKWKFLGNVVITIKQVAKGFCLIEINGNKIKMDNIPDYSDGNQNGQVHECNISDDYWHQAHYRKNGISHIVLFNSERIRDYYISH